jgi:hypothetical protein
MTKKTIYLLLWLAGIMVACQREYPLIVPPAPNVLVINGLFSPDSVWRVQVSQPRTVTDTAMDFQPVSDARVRIWVADSLVATLRHAGAGWYEGEQFPQIGITYRLEAEAEGFPPAVAEDRIPMPAQSLAGYMDTTEIISRIDGTLGVSGSTWYPVYVSFQDPATEPSYYRFLGAKYDSAIYTDGGGDEILWVDSMYNELEPSTYLSNDASIQSFDRDQSLLITTDAGTNGQRRETVLLATSYLFYFNDFTSNGSDDPRKILELFVVLYTISEVYYQYAYSLLQQGYQTTDPFATHNNVVSNVEGGLGIFAGYHRQMVRVF